MSLSNGNSKLFGFLRNLLPFSKYKYKTMFLVFNSAHELFHIIIKCLCTVLAKMKIIFSVFFVFKFFVQLTRKFDNNRNKINSAAHGSKRLYTGRVRPFLQIILVRFILFLKS